MIILLVQSNSEMTQKLADGTVYPKSDISA